MDSAAPARGGAADMNVLWYGTVDKVGSNLTAHRRVVFVTDANLFVCLTTGGVTRTVEAQRIDRVAIIPPNVAHLTIHEEPDLVLCCVEGPQQRDALVEALQQATGGRVVAVEQRSLSSTTSVAAEQRSRAIEQGHSQGEGGATRHAEDAGAMRLAQAQPLPPGNDAEERDLPWATRDAPRPPHPPESAAAATAAGSAWPKQPSGAAGQRPVIPPAVPQGHDRSNSSVGEPNAVFAGTHAASARPSDPAGWGVPPPPAASPAALSPQSIGEAQQARQPPSPRPQGSAAGLGVSLGTLRSVLTGGGANGVEAGGGGVSGAPRAGSAQPSQTPPPPDGFLDHSLRREPLSPQASAETSPPRRCDPEHRTLPTPTAVESAAETRGKSAAHPAADSSFDSRMLQREQQLMELRAATEMQLPLAPPSELFRLQQTVERQQQVIGDLQRRVSEDVAAELRRDLEHQKALVIDLQTALRTQEGAFAEMMRAQERLAASEAIRSNLEKRVAALEEENKRLRTEGSVKDAELAAAAERATTAKAEHDAEVAQIRVAFADYDARVTDFIEKKQQEHARERAELVEALNMAQLAIHNPRPLPHYQPPAAQATLQPPTPPPLAEHHHHHHHEQQKQQQQQQQRAAMPSPAAPSPRAADAEGAAALRHALVDKLNAYVNRKYNLPHAHPSPPELHERAQRLHERDNGGFSHQPPHQSEQPHQHQRCERRLVSDAGAERDEQWHHSPGPSAGRPRVRDRSIL